MKIKYRLSQDDYLQQQLYDASKSKRVKHARLRSWLILSISFAICAFLLYSAGEKTIFYYSTVVALLTFIFYPFYLRKRYWNHYLKHISEIRKNKDDEEITLAFNENQLEASQLSGESKINYSSFEKITEISSHFFIKLKTGGTIIIPKSGVDDIAKTGMELKAISKRTKLDYYSELEWKWK